MAKTKALISCAITAQLICAFVFRIGKNPVFSRCGSGTELFYLSSSCIYFQCFLGDLILALLNISSGGLSSEGSMSEGRSSGSAREIMSDVTKNGYQV